MYIYIYIYIYIHNIISLEIYIPSKHTVKTSFLRTVYRDIKSIDFELFSDNIKTNFEIYIRIYLNIIPNINSLNTCLKLNLDISAPTKINYFKVRSNKPWFNSYTLEAKRLTRKFEIIYLKNPSITNYKQLYTARNAYRMKLSLNKRNYYKNNIFSYGNNSKKFYSISRKLLGNESHLNYPPFSNEKLCSYFIENFDSKVINICNKINNIVLNEDISTPSISVPIC